MCRARRFRRAQGPRYTQRVDFLLECIGFPPDFPTDDIIARVLAQGESAAWRGDPARHRRLPLGGGLELRMDKDEGQTRWNLLPHFQVEHRLRVAVDEIRKLPDSPFDALLIGWAAPPIDAHAARASPGAYRLCTYITDARRLPKKLAPGHVLAVCVAGFALDVTYVGPDDGAFDPEACRKRAKKYRAEARKWRAGRKRSKDGR